MKQRILPITLRVSAVLALVIGFFLSYEGDTSAVEPAASVDPDEVFVLQTDRPTGKLVFEIIDSRSRVLLPARLYFAYADGRDEVPTVGRFKNYLVTASGREQKTLPVGEYDVFVSRGTEYSLASQKVKIEEGKTAFLKAELQRVVDTTGFISSDFHLHLSFEMRDGAIVAAAEGLDLLTATDHNVLKDYKPYIQELGLERFMKSTVGSEIDTAFGHFNSFPLRLDRWASRDYRHAIRTPGEFLRVVRQEPGEQIVQINHPRRWETSPVSGYFDGRLNKTSGNFDYPFFEAGFDSFEVFNAVVDQMDGHIGRTELVEQKLRDWYGMLNRGVLMAAVANTDAHDYPRHVPAYPRNYISSPTDNPWEIDPESVVTQVKGLATTAAGGPYISFTGEGETVGSLVTDTDQSVSLRIQVQSPAWIPFEKVEVVSNGKVIQYYSVDVPEEGQPWRFATELVVQPQEDSWYLVLASSEQPWDKPFENYSSFSFTNPIFVDVDGNGYFDPPNGGHPLEPGSE